MRLSKQLFQDRLTVPDNWRDLDTYKLFEECGFVEFPYSGFPLFLPIGKRVMESICGIIRKEAETSGFNEVYLPLVQSRSFLESTGRADLFGNEFMELKDGLDGYILSPTNEEIFLDLAQRGLSSYRQLPVKIYQDGIGSCIQKSWNFDVQCLCECFFLLACLVRRLKEYVLVIGVDSQSA